jgi:hypothetical protein
MVEQRPTTLQCIGVHRDPPFLSALRAAIAALRARVGAPLGGGSSSERKKFLASEGVGARESESEREQRLVQRGDFSGGRSAVRLWRGAGFPACAPLTCLVHKAKAKAHEGLPPVIKALTMDECEE